MSPPVLWRRPDLMPSNTRGEPATAPKPNPAPEEEDLNDPTQQQTNVDRDGRERYPNEQADQK